MWGKSECMVDDVYEVNEAFWNAKEILGECKTKIKTIWRIVNLYLLFIFVLLFSKYKEKKCFTELNDIMKQWIPNTKLLFITDHNI